MNDFVEKKQTIKARPATGPGSSVNYKHEANRYQDNRLKTIMQRQLQADADPCSRVNSKASDKEEILQKNKNSTGLPDNLKTGMENLSGKDLSHVKVHYNSSKPAVVQAHAYAQGGEIHLASGQEKHLAHELGHIVQQMQGRVKATTSAGDMPVNENYGIQGETSVPGLGASVGVKQRCSVIQRVITLNDDESEFSAVMMEEKIKAEDEGNWDDSFHDLLVALDDEGADFDDYMDMMDYLKGYGGNEEQSFEISLHGTVIFFEDIDEYLEQKDEVEATLQRIEDSYGFQVSDDESLSAVRYENEKSLEKDYDPVKDRKKIQAIHKSLKKLSASSIDIDTLRAIEDTFKRFSTILGANRENGSRSGVEQEINTVGMLESDPSGPGDALTSQHEKNIHLYENAVIDGDNNYANTLRTLIHEMSHGFLEHRLDYFVEHLSWWKTANASLLPEEKIHLYEESGLETPVNHYGTTNANEDMAEVTRLYLFSNTHRAKLKADYPERYRTISSIIKDEMGLDEAGIISLLADIETDEIEGHIDYQVQTWDVIETAKYDLPDRIKLFNDLCIKQKIKVEKYKKEVNRLSHLKNLTKNLTNRQELFIRKQKNTEKMVVEYKNRIKELESMLNE